LWTNPKKKPWFEHPKRMLQWRARAYAMRDGFADCLMGLAVREEIEDLTPEPVVTDTSFLDDAVLEPVADDGQKALPSPSEKPLPGRSSAAPHPAGCRREFGWNLLAWPPVG
jgi:hypothetical protein